MLDCHGTHGLVAMTSAYHAEGRQFDPGWVYLDFCQILYFPEAVLICEIKKLQYATQASQRIIVKELAVNILQDCFRTHGFCRDAGGLQAS